MMKIEKERWRREVREMEGLTKSVVGQEMNHIVIRIPTTE